MALKFEQGEAITMQAQIANATGAFILSADKVQPSKGASRD